MYIFMETTIAVKGSTAQLLMMLKERLQAKSIDEAIVMTLQRVEGVSKTRFGSSVNLREFSRKERANSHEL